jgi:pimeloyl-ACP methyl ester carboxylesterase
MSTREDSTNELQAWQVPVLCVAGTEDSITPSEVLESMSRSMSRSRYIKIPHTGHLTPLEAPEAFCQELLPWLLSGAR